MSTLFFGREQQLTAVFVLLLATFLRTFEKECVKNDTLLTLTTYITRCHIY